MAVGSAVWVMKHPDSGVVEPTALGVIDVFPIDDAATRDRPMTGVGGDYY